MIENNKKYGNMILWREKVGKEEKEAEEEEAADRETSFLFPPADFMSVTIFSALVFCLSPPFL